MINISELLDDDLFIQPIEVGFTTRTIDSNGDPQESVAWETLDCNVQTVGDDQLQRLPEAERYKSSRQMFTNRKEVRIGDYFKYRGQTYRCVADQDFDDYGYSDVIGILYNGTEDISNDGFELPYE